MVKPRSKISVAEIEQYVARGHSQSAANCRVLLDEIHRLRNHKSSWPEGAEQCPDCGGHGFTL